MSRWTAQYEFKWHGWGYYLRSFCLRDSNSFPQDSVQNHSKYSHELASLCGVRSIKQSTKYLVILVYGSSTAAATAVIHLPYISFNLQHRLNRMNIRLWIVCAFKIIPGVVCVYKLRLWFRMLTIPPRYFFIRSYERMHFLPFSFSLSLPPPLSRSVAVHTWIFSPFDGVIY